MNMSTPGELVTAAPRSERAIGAILVAGGRLGADDAERIVQLQREKKLRFGEAGLTLGLLRQADIDYAISRQFDYPYLAADDPSVGPEVTAAFHPFRSVVEQLRALRSQLMLRWFGAEPTTGRAIAIASAERHEGRSFIAANLAVVFAQLGQRTLLIDADLRNPAQHRFFRLDNRTGLSNLLSGRCGTEAIRPIAGLRTLSVLPAGTLPPNPQELLSRPSFAGLLDRAAREFEVVIVDTPAGAANADAHVVAARTRGALVVARKDHSRAAALARFGRSLAHSGVTVVGSVMNRH
jgi:receptor protein-tyrosine kinase